MFFTYINNYLIFESTEKQDERRQDLPVFSDSDSDYTVMQAYSMTKNKALNLHTSMSPRGNPELLLILPYFSFPRRTAHVMNFVQTVLWSSLLMSNVQMIKQDMSQHKILSHQIQG